mgnify:CR=1 FL=1
MYVYIRSAHIFYSKCPVLGWEFPSGVKSSYYLVTSESNVALIILLLLSDVKDFFAQIFSTIKDITTFLKDNTFV